MHKELNSHMTRRPGADRERRKKRKKREILGLEKTGLPLLCGSLFVRKKQAAGKAACKNFKMIIFVVITSGESTTESRQVRIIQLQQLHLQLRERQDLQRLRKQEREFQHNRCGRSFQQQEIRSQC